MLFTCLPEGAQIPGRFPGPMHARGKWFTIDIHCHLLTQKAEEMVKDAGLSMDWQPRHHFANERTREVKLRDAVAGGQTSFTFGDMSFSHNQMTQELSRRFMHLKEAETAVAAPPDLELHAAKRTSQSRNPRQTRRDQKKPRRRTAGAKKP